MLYSTNHWFYHVCPLHYILNITLANVVGYLLLSLLFLFEQTEEREGKAEMLRLQQEGLLAMCSLT